MIPINISRRFRWKFDNTSQIDCTTTIYEQFRLTYNIRCGFCKTQNKNPYEKHKALILLNFKHFIESRYNLKTRFQVYLLVTQHM